MKKLMPKKGVECMACLECVRACSNAFYKEFHPDLSCVQVVAKGTGAKPMTCIQCGKCMKACASILAWRIPWTEKPGGLQSMGLHRVGHD